jgi:hypothetical protein
LVNSNPEVFHEHYMDITTTEFGTTSYFPLYAITERLYVRNQFQDNPTATISQLCEWPGGSLSLRLYRPGRESPG